MIIDPHQVTVETGSSYPEIFESAVAGRIKQRLGNAAGLKNFGVNLTRLAPGSRSALRHWHSHQDEFIYVLQGAITLVTGEGEQVLRAGMAAGFPAGTEDGHHLINRSDTDVAYLEVGDRTAQDRVSYPDNDLVAVQTELGWKFSHRDGAPYL
ncbi:hypothetical protein C1752_00110 [Acaryochloris thomasi RCC1774]|uniref:Cupin type-2 domain-containing protein n=1 Tax=Acaryochloris thomasi RCC1774 TaxID=1764569 RepID=A0A2W1JZQ4_9CYAN|nr:cupin domain-containing protein [Acaryochloris thomasi]PZD75392.1 hypothetical protein C1752_00110 [Acaryochloris thomasi RCC1774]